ncbi:MAG: MarR family transcriptional regulator [Betaproteobacteria bacterium]
MNEKATKPSNAAATRSQLTFALVHAAHAIETRWQESLAGVGLSTAKLGALTVLVQAGEPLSLGDLAARLTCVRSNITQLVDRLDADGLVRRVENPADRRSKKAAITPRGIERQAAGTREIERVQKELGNALSAIDPMMLERVLAKLK